MKFLLLRPLSKASTSQQAFLQAGIDVSVLALLDIEALPEYIELAKHQVAALDSDSRIIVTSTSAANILVEHGIKPINSQHIIAIGKSTAAILRQAGYQIIQPPQANSESLLALPILQNIDNKQVVICKGEGGRTLIKEALTAKGGKIQEWNVYRRVVLSSPVSSTQWDPADIDCLIATSGELLQASFSHYPQQWLQSSQWLVVSQRIADLATKLGVQKVAVCNDASDEGLISWLTQHGRSLEQNLEH